MSEEINGGRLDRIEEILAETVALQRGMQSAQMQDEFKFAEYRKQEELKFAEYRKQEESKFAEYRKQEELKLAEYRKQEELKSAEYRKQEELKSAEYRKQSENRFARIESVLDHLTQLVGIFGDKSYQVDEKMKRIKDVL